MLANVKHMLEIILNAIMIGLGSAIGTAIANILIIRRFEKAAKDIKRVVQKLNGVE